MSYDLPLMNPSNQKNDLTAFTISIEAKEGITTGISAADRAHTISVAINVIIEINLILFLLVIYFH